MKIYIKDDKLIAEVDFWQHKNNCYDEREEKELTHNLIGVHAGDMEQGIYQLNDLSYKDSQQVGSPLIHTYLEKEEFIKLCVKLGISYFEYPECVRCHKVIWGSHTWDDGAICFDCENKKKYPVVAE